MNSEPDPIEDAIWDIWEHYLETPLFRDANIPQVNALLHAMHTDVMEVIDAIREPL